MNSLRDIVEALQHPAPRSPLAPLTDSHMEALLQLTALLSNIAKRPEPTVAAPAAQPLRVEANATPHNATPAIEATPPACIPNNNKETTTAPLLRVEPTKQPSRHLIDSDEHELPSNLKPPVQHTVTPPIPSIVTPPAVTFASSTGPTGKRRRKQARKPKAPAPPNPRTTKTH
jgi:hypothetical protein